LIKNIHLQMKMTNFIF